MDDIGFFDEDGLWVSENVQNFKHYLSKNANVRTVLKVKKWHKQRTIPQNDYLHWAFNYLGEKIGYTMGEVKGSYKIMLGVKETSALDTIGLADFIDKFRQHALEFHGHYVPLPNEVIYE